MFIFKYSFLSVLILSHIASSNPIDGYEPENRNRNDDDFPDDSPQNLTTNQETAITTWNCSRTSECLANSVCNHQKCRCKLSYIWDWDLMECIPKKCITSYECFNVYSNSMCSGYGCVCAFGYTLEQSTQMCRYTGFMNSGGYLLFGSIGTCVLLLWMMLPGVLLLIKKNKKRRKLRLRNQRLKEASEAASQSSADSTTEQASAPASSTSDSENGDAASTPATPTTVNNSMTPSFATASTFSNSSTSSSSTNASIMTPYNYEIEEDVIIEEVDEEDEESQNSPEPQESQNPFTLPSGTTSGTTNPFEKFFGCGNAARNSEETTCKTKLSENCAQVQSDRLLFETANELLNELLNANSNETSAKTLPNLDAPRSRISSRRTSLVPPTSGLATSSVTNSNSSSTSVTNSTSSSRLIQNLISQRSSLTQSQIPAPGIQTSRPVTPNLQTQMSTSTSGSSSSRPSTRNSISRVNSQNSSSSSGNTNSNTSSQNFPSYEALCHPPPPYTPPMSPRVAISRTESQIDPPEQGFQSELLADVPRDLLSQALFDEYLSSSPIVSRTNSTSNLNILFNSSTNPLTSEPVPEEQEELEVEVGEEVIPEGEEIPNYGPVCQPPPPYFKRADNDLDTKNLPEPCTSRASQESIIREEKKIAAALASNADSQLNIIQEEDDAIPEKQDGSQPETQNPEEEEEDDEEETAASITSFDYTKSLNRRKVDII